jgi:hypothetical protein
MIPLRKTLLLVFIALIILPSVLPNNTFVTSQSTYTVTFTQSGERVAWAVTLDGIMRSSAPGGSITFTVAAGSHSWYVHQQAGYAISSYDTSPTYVSYDKSIYITFAKLNKVTFWASGLKSGTTWSVTLSGSLYSKTLSSTYPWADIVFQDVPPGQYTWAASSVYGYDTPTPDTISVYWDTSRSVLYTEKKYPVTFTETGLAAGTSWTATFNGQTKSSTSNSIQFDPVPNGVYTYTVGPVSGYSGPVPQAGSITVNNQAVTWPVTYSPNKYPVTFTETGLAAGTSWTATFNGQTKSSTSNSIQFDPVPNGVYTYTVGPVSGYSGPVPQAGSITVNGQDVSQSVSYTPHDTPTYTVTFTQSGLAGISWSVTFNGETKSSSASSIVFTDVLAGSYFWSPGSVTDYSTSAVGGLIVVVSDNLQTITYTKDQSLSKYSVTFSTNGLPSGISWAMTFNGILKSGPPGSAISFNDVSGGTYTFAVSPVNGYTISPSSGQITVVNSNINQQITFTPPPPVKYSVTFTQSGLATSTSWSATFNGQTKSSTTSSISFANVPSGTYQFSVPSIGDYTASPSSGSISVSQNINRAITYTPPTYSTSWDFILNSYSVPNTGSIWSPLGNCQAYAVTSFFYYMHYTKGEFSYPYFPAQSKETRNTADLELPPYDEYRMSYGMNNAYLAITFHQLFGRATTMNHEGLNEIQRQKQDFNNLLDSLRKDVPAILQLAKTTDKEYPHAVVAYGAKLISGSSYIIYISDNNMEQKEMTATFDTASGQFNYKDGHSEYTKFRVINPQMRPDESKMQWYNNFGSWWWTEYRSLKITDYTLVVSEKPLTIKSLDNKSTYFKETGNSGTLVNGIPGSYGISEGTMEVYVIPRGLSFKILDPTVEQSTIFVAQLDNISGKLVGRGYVVSAMSPGGISIIR